MGTDTTPALAHARVLGEILYRPAEDVLAGSPFDAKIEAGDLAAVIRSVAGKMSSRHLFDAIPISGTLRITG